MPDNERVRDHIPETELNAAFKTIMKEAYKGVENHDVTVRPHEEVQPTLAF